MKVYLLIKHHPMKVYLLIKNHAMKKCLGAEVQLHAFLTSAQDGGVWSASRHSRFTSGEGKEPPVPFGQEAGRAPEAVWTLWRREKFRPVVQAVALSLHRLSYPSSTLLMVGN